MTSPVGVHRVLEPAGVLPQAARRLDAAPQVGDDEVRIAVRRLNLDAASFRQLRELHGGDGAAVRAAVLEIINGRGKMHNPVTGSGGMLIGTVAEVGARSPLGLRVGDRVATLVSLTLTPLAVTDGLAGWDGAGEQVPCEGHAILFARSAVAVLPDDLDAGLCLAVLDVCGAPALTARVTAGYAPGRGGAFGASAPGAGVGGYSASTPGVGGYSASAPSVGGYSASAPSVGGYSASAPSVGGHSASAPAVDSASAPAVGGGHAAGAPSDGTGATSAGAGGHGAAAGGGQDAAPGAGPTVLVLGGAGKSGSLSLAAARRAGAGRTAAVVPTGAERDRLVAAGLADVVVVADARDAVGVSAAVLAALGAPAQVTVVCVDVPGCEHGAILCTAAGGTVVFFSMATSFPAAALGAEGLAADVTMLIGNGYLPGHAAYALELVRTEPGVRGLFAARLAAD